MAIKMAMPPQLRYLQGSIGVQRRETDRPWIFEDDVTHAMDQTNLYNGRVNGDYYSVKS